MATYGGQGQNEVSYYVGTAAETRPFSIVYNPTTNVSQVYVRTGNNLFGVPQFDPVGTINFNTGKRTLIPSTNLSASEERAFNLGVSWSDDTKGVISNASSSANPDQLLQPRGTQPAPSAPGSTGTGGGTDTGGEPTESTSGEVDALSPAGEQVFGKDEFGYYIYPKEMNSGQDRIQFYQIKYVRDKVIQTETDIINKETKTKILGGVTLPMPNDISETNTVGWGEDGLSNAGAMFMQPLTEAAQIITSGQNMGQLKENVADPLAAAFKNQALKNRVTKTLAVGAAAGVVGKFGININKEAYISRATGAAINPNLEFLFNGPKLRQFGFQFKLVARSQDEAKEIRKIIRFFKKGMSPRRTKAEDWDFFLGTPNVFRIKYMSSGNKDFSSQSTDNQLKSIGQIKTCALVSFNANYTPDGFYAAYEDSAAGGSQPIAVTIQMAFTELTPVFSDEYDDSTEDTVGPNKFTEDYNILDTSGGDNK